MKPNLFIAGFQKCGSSTLFDLLTKHPDICGSQPKETFYLTDRGYDNFDPDRNIANGEISWDYFANPGACKYFLEGSVCNFYQKTALDYIACQPESRVIFIIRDPVKRFFSNYTYYYGKVNGIDPDVSIEKYVELVRSNHYERQSLRFALEHGCYSRYIQLWVDRLGSDRVFVLSLEQLTRSTQKTLDKLFAFLGLPISQKSDLPWENRSVIHKYPMFHKVMVSVFRKSPIATGFVRKIYMQIFYRRAEFNPSETLLAQLRTYYEEEYRNYSSYFK